MNTLWSTDSVCPWKERRAEVDSELQFAADNKILRKTVLFHFISFLLCLVYRENPDWWILL